MPASVTAGEAHALLVMIGKRLEHSVGEYFNEIDLSPPQFEIMRFLWLRDHLTLGELSHYCGCVPANITGLVDRLEKKGLLKRVPVPGDRRVARISLTEAGKQLRDPAGKVMEQYLAIFQGLDQEELRSLVVLLKKLFRHLEGPGSGAFLEMLINAE